MDIIPVENSDMKRFNPKKPITICYWFVEGFGMALGFFQNYLENKKMMELGAVFSPKIAPVEWGRRNPIFGEKTETIFRVLWLKLYNVKPILIDDSRYPVHSHVGA